MGNEVKLTLSARDIRTGKIAVEVVTDDNGNENGAGVHLWSDGGANTKDVQLDKWKGKTADGSGSDIFTGTISPEQLPEAMRGKELGITAYGTIPHRPRIWSGVDDKVKPAAQNLQLDAPELVNPDRQLTRKALSVQMEIGELTVVQLTQEKTGYKSTSGEEYLVGFALRPSEALRQANPEKIDLWFAPSVKERDYRYGSWGATRDVTKVYDDYKKQNTVTLYKQEDGTYARRADPDKCFARVGEYSIYMGGNQDLKEWKLAACFGPGQWDSRGGKNYPVDMDGPGAIWTMEHYIENVPVERMSDCRIMAHRVFDPAVASGDVATVVQALDAIAAEYPDAAATRNMAQVFTDRVAEAMRQPDSQVGNDMVRFVLDRFNPSGAGGLAEAAVQANSQPLLATVCDWAAERGQPEVFDQALEAIAYNKDADIGLVTYLLENHEPSTRMMDDKLETSFARYDVKVELVEHGGCSQSGYDSALHMAAFQVDTATAHLILSRGNPSTEGIQEAYARLLTTPMGDAEAKRALIRMFIDAGAQ